MRRRSLKNGTEVSKPEAAQSPADVKQEVVAAAANVKPIPGYAAGTVVRTNEFRAKSMAAAAENFNRQLDEFYKRLSTTVEQLYQDLEATSDATVLFNNIWFMNELFIPILPNGSGIQLGHFKIRFGEPESASLCWQTLKSTTKSAPRARTMTADSMDSTASSASACKLPLSDVSLNVPPKIEAEVTDENTVPDDSTTVKPKTTGEENRYSDDLSQLVSDVKTFPDGSTRHVALNSGKPVAHSLFAINQLGKCSLPIVAFPKRSDLELGYQNDLFTRKVCSETTQTGLINNIDLFLDWLPQFCGQLRRPFVDPDSRSDLSSPPTDLKQLPHIVLILSDNFKNFLAKNSSPESVQRLVKLCKANRVLMFFYPAPTNRKHDFFYKSTLEKFTLAWQPVLLQFAAKNKLNLNSQTGFIHALVQTLRSMYDPAFKVSMCSHHLYGLGKCIPPIYVVPENFEDFTEEFKQLGGAHEWLKRLFSTSKLSSELETAFAASLTALEQAYTAGLAQAQQNSIESEIEKVVKPTATTATTHANGVAMESNDENNDDDTSQSHSVAGGSVAVPRASVVQPKLTEEELEAICEWVDEMSKIGCLCIKYTFLRDLYIKSRAGVDKSGVKESIAMEKRWLDVVNKNQSKFKYKLSFGLNENEHMVRWFDMEYWRVAYQKYLKQCKITSADQVWTFEMLNFPFQSSNGVTRAPEKDYQQRPRNFKPHISVIFAYSACGDYLQPYFVYPSDFCQIKQRKSLRPGEVVQEQAVTAATVATTNGETVPPMPHAEVSMASASAATDSSAPPPPPPEPVEDIPMKAAENDPPLNESLETYARNGYVTSAIFEKWLNQAFIPYINKKATGGKPDQEAAVSEAESAAGKDENNVEMKEEAEDAMPKTEPDAKPTSETKSLPTGPSKLLLYCGKLAIINQTNLDLCKQNKVCLFAITDENTIPFNYLFVKSLRKRHTDLFLESWRKVTSRLNLGYQFKCKSRHLFYSVFMDAFQNCMEEIDNTNETVQQPSTSLLNSADSCGGQPMSETTASASTPLKTSTASSAIVSFRAKMASTFEQCELWPINAAAYKKYKENLDEKEKQSAESSKQAAN